jgi:UDP-N-acetylglucosamine 2-epimerase (non-hydrolysing)
MSAVFFEDLAIPPPDIELEVGSGSHAVQTAEILRRFEGVLEAEQPHAVLVVGDVNSTIACALATTKFGLDQTFDSALGKRRRPLLIHVEAGLRSFDQDMPEEANRRLTDTISDALLVSEPSGMVNLAREGVAPDRCHFVGNVMIDALYAVKEHAAKNKVLHSLGVEGRPYGLVTLHRVSNLDDGLMDLLATLDEISHVMPLVFPVHPRTRLKIARGACRSDRWRLTEPLGYAAFVKVMSEASVVFTDSGGVQDETTALGVPCLTLRDNTERPVTLDEGTNRLVGTQRADILTGFMRVTTAAVPLRLRRVPHLWDGNAAHRIADVVEGLFQAK